jgi:hypothetical protein
MTAIKNDWTEIPNYNGRYLIHPNGVVLNQKKYPKKAIVRRSYLTVKLFKNGRSRTEHVHRLLALTFIPDPQKKSEVNHINGNKLDNSLHNLEWVSHSENMKHAYDYGLCKKNSQTPVINLESRQGFASIKEAANAHGIPYSTCKNYLNGARPNPTPLRYLRKTA